MVLLEYIPGSSPIFPHLERLTLQSRALNADTYKLLADFLRVPSIRESLKYLNLSKFVNGTRRVLPAEGLPLPSGLSDLAIIIPVDLRIPASSCRSMLTAIAQTMSMRASDSDAVPLNLFLRFDIRYFYEDVDLRRYLAIPEEVQERNGEETNDGAELAQALFTDDDYDDEEYEPLADNLSQGSSNDSDDDDDVHAIVDENELDFCRNQMLLPKAVSTLDGTIADVGLNLQGLDVEFVNCLGAIIKDNLGETTFWDTFRQEFPATAARFQSLRTS
ncbi:hypothetical protein CYLTODRAFT_494604 [Cylindrobasidium torrendii FP15055 ss-10]|uniref:Uncharacterized protein n=1 Tax=Cylindrobasidium torrendii FP15055 ss-10 TaxID=1314674 RepID=A0A0D7AW78_9AGAR|nr:hypothetical protein CYLTODRAFT_494604 [Cylindrobasidium torrendii FP15055 ss-10]